MKHLYRFRTIKSLFEFKELENQEIYFASPDELNDPMEGFKDMIWCGDQVVWANLLKHYLLCLDDFFVLFLISNSSKDQKFQLSESKINIFKTKECFENSNQIDIYKEICKLFFSNQEIADFPKFLASRIKPIRKNELSFYLQSLHLHALNAIFAAYEKYAGIKNVLNGYELKAINLDGLSQINIIEENHPNAEDGAEKFFTFSGMKLAEIDLITQFNHDNIKNNEMQFFSWFPKAYVKRLENLSYPNWYAACFNKNCHNSSMWSHYGDKHKGVCLKFKINSIDEKFFIRLSQTLNWDGRETKPTTHCHDNLFYKIQYDKKHPEIDFFRSFQLPIPVLNANWYVSENGQISSCHDDVFDNVSEWRNQYWVKFINPITVKNQDWDYEKEYRLILTGMTSDLDLSERKLKYDFNDLEGIIFGINTSEQDKLEIIKIIESKCRTNNRNNFKFYQAYYSSYNGKIESKELSFIKFKGL